MLASVDESVGRVLATLDELKLSEQTLDGVSWLPLVKGEKAKLDREALYWHFPGYLGAGQGSWRTTPAGAIRMGKWKLHEFFEDGRIELYNLKDDPGERKDLAATNPQKRDEMAKKLAAWREAIEAPMPEKQKN